MFDTIGYWLTVVPLEGIWRAIVIVAEVLAFAFALHWLWELSFWLADGMRRVASRYKGRSRSGIPATAPELVVSVDSAYESKPISAIQAGRISVKADEVA
jgi:hypothetical protein